MANGGNILDGSADSLQQLRNLGIMVDDPNQSGFASFGSLNATGIPNNQIASGGQQQSNLFGNLSTGASTLANLANVYTGLKQLGLAREQLDLTRSAFDTNVFNQARPINAELRTRQERRNRDNPNSMPVEEFMARFGVTERRL